MEKVQGEYQSKTQTKEYVISRGNPHEKGKEENLFDPDVLDCKYREI
jgi:hypothetical protein